MTSPTPDPTMIRSLLFSSAFLLALVEPVQIVAQSVCSDYHKFNCQPAGDKRWSLNGQSKSASIQVGRETELNIIIYSGQDYRISLCQDMKVLGEELAIRLVEKVRVPKGDAGGNSQPIVDEEGKRTGTTRKIQDDDRLFEEIEKVLWDNTEHEMAQEVEFSCASTKRIAVQIVAPGAEGKSRRGDKQFDIGCVGILIEHMVTPDLGF
jgi:hypothetical protein